jgi:hypothetical protein
MAELAYRKYNLFPSRDRPSCVCKRSIFMLAIRMVAALIRT